MVTGEFYEEEVLIDEEVRASLDVPLLALDGVTSEGLLGGVSYVVESRPFAILLEGVIAMTLPEELRRMALTLAGVSPFISPSADDEYARWVQFLLLLPEDIPAVQPWLEAAYGYVSAPQDA